MASSSSSFRSLEVHLTRSVEELIGEICRKHSISPPNDGARRKLSDLGEEASLRLLRHISSTRIVDFSALIMLRTKQPEFAIAGSPKPLEFGTWENYFSGPRSPCFSPPGGNYSPMPTPDTMSPASHFPRPGRVPPKDTALSILEALGELDFRRAFLIISYAGRNKLEDIISVDIIKNLKYLPMVSFELELWNIISSKDESVRSVSISEFERRKNFDWDSGKTHIYHCQVDPQGNFTFKGPSLQISQTHLHRVLGDDHVLLVKFAEEKHNTSINNLGCCRSVYHRIAKEGIPVGLRRYHFLVFKDGGKEEKKKDPTSSAVKCYFICIASNWLMDINRPYILYGKTINEARTMFMHAHTVSTMAKYMARFSLILSKTIKLDVDLSVVRITTIEDIPCRDESGVVCNEDGDPKIHTDGTGFISEDLAIRCPKSIYKGQHVIPMNFQRLLGGLEVERSSNLRQLLSIICEPPLLIQFRLFKNGLAVKGTLLLNKQLPSKTIQIRPSMIKVRPDTNISTTQSCNSLEIVGTSNQPKRSYLSKTLIALLHYGGVPEEYFLTLLVNALHEAHGARYDRKTALKAALRYGSMDDFLAARMIICGVPLEEPYLQSRLRVLMREEKKGLRGGRIPMSDCYYLMGTADPTGTLKAREVCIILQNGQVSGDVLVYKHPGLHFGDIHRLTATYIPDLEQIVGNAKYAIFFPTRGPRSLADEMANSDFDGDIYWVSKNSQLLEHYKPSKPWEPPHSMSRGLQPKPSSFSSTELERELFQQYLVARFSPSNAMSAASDSWLVFMDRLLTQNISGEEKQRLIGKMLQLVNIYYEALDANKSGTKVNVPNELRPEMYPHFMERSNSYRSTSVLGRIFDVVDKFQEEDPLSGEIPKLPCLSNVAPNSCIELWGQHYNEYKKEMRRAMLLAGEAKDLASAIILKYKRILYGAEEFEQATRARVEIFNEALAIYQIVYEYGNRVKDVGRCSFAWRVAGHALCQLHAEKQEEGAGVTMVCSKAVLQEILG